LQPLDNLGPSDPADISGIDEGESAIHQRVLVVRLTTDEAIITWNDGTIKGLALSNMDFIGSSPSFSICNLFFSNCKLQ
jgi:hypothetical protein